MRVNQVAHDSEAEMTTTRNTPPQFALLHLRAAWPTSAQPGTQPLAAMAYRVASACTLNRCFHGLGSRNSGSFRGRP